MSLPISTPPNALAHATGYTDTNGMAKTGIVMGILGLAIAYVMMFFLAKINFFGEQVKKPETVVEKAAVVETVKEVPAEPVKDTVVAVPEAVLSDTAKVMDSSVIPAAN